MYKKETYSKDFKYFGAFLTLLLLNSAVLILFPLNWTTIPMLFLQGVMFVGLVEAFHQSVHSNLLPEKNLNKIVGMLLGAFLGTSYAAYKRFHIKHHQTTNSHEDPEERFYKKAQGRITAFLMIPIKIAGQAGVVNSSTDLLRSSDKKSHRISMFLNGLRTVLIVFFLFFYPIETVSVFILPMLIFSYYEYFMSHSQHYQKPYTETPPQGMQHYNYSRNLELPSWIGFLSLYTNYHASHHAVPGAKWYEMPALAREHGEKSSSVTVPYFGFVKNWWRNGERQWPNSISPLEG